MEKIIRFTAKALLFVICGCCMKLAQIQCTHSYFDNTRHEAIKSQRVHILMINEQGYLESLEGINELSDPDGATRADNDLRD